MRKPRPRKSYIRSWGQSWDWGLALTLGLAFSHTTCTWKGLSAWEGEREETPGEVNIDIMVFTL